MKLRSSAVTRSVNESGGARLPDRSTEEIDQWPLRSKRLLDLLSRREVGERVDQDARSLLQILDRDLLVDVVARIRLAREPHAEGDRVRKTFRIRAAAGDRRLHTRAGCLRVVIEQAPH